MESPFCEGKWAAPDALVREPVNTASSVFMSLSAIIPVFAHISGKLHIVRTSMFTCGLGSAMYHATLSPTWKLADEIPMILISSFLTMSFASKFPNPCAKPWVICVITTYLFTTIFIDSTNLDQSQIGFRTLFMIPFVVILGINIALFRGLDTMLQYDQNKKDAMFTCGKACLVISLLAGSCWLIDSKACNYQWVSYLELHSLWHLGVSAVSYLLICISACFSPKNTILWKWHFPIVVSAETPLLEMEAFSEP